MAGRVRRRARAPRNGRALMTCVAGEHPIERASRVPGLCATCYDRLPKVTRDLYERGGLQVRRVGELARTRNASFKVVRAMK